MERDLKMRVAIGAPGNGAALKDELKAHLEADPRVSEVIDLSTAEITYPQVSFQAARAVLDGTAERAILVCGTGIGTAIAASKVKGARAATAHNLLTVRGSVENYDAQILCMGQNVIAPVAAKALVDVWLDLRHDPASNYGLRLTEIDDYETR
ncbi:RpiB/LacA/LacB family sugar-phosphate isomerase [Pseudactinotalea sp. Z1748]|uniref:RpiB/LacA/LacB family sugar-phosphate isomerase n=1 Tax=Pseudactinotalea sp. Z1748 TaxID=3413027 RepID=UPI003C7D28F6